MFNDMFDKSHWQIPCHVTNTLPRDLISNKVSRLLEGCNISGIQFRGTDRNAGTQIPQICDRNSILQTSLRIFTPTVIYSF